MSDLTEQDRKIITATIIAAISLAAICGFFYFMGQRDCSCAQDEGKHTIPTYQERVQHQWSLRICKRDLMACEQSKERILEDLRQARLKIFLLGGRP